jgi:hypothetical protein
MKKAHEHSHHTVTPEQPGIPRSEQICPDGSEMFENQK